MALAGEAGAKPRVRANSFNVAAATIEPLPSIQAPARFFTISAVLANHGQGNASGQPQPATVASKPSPRDNQPFGLTTFRAPDGALWGKWRTIEARMAGESLLLQVCHTDATSCAQPVRAMLGMLDATRSATGLAQVRAVNGIVNGALRYVSDLAQHGVADLWSSPLTTLASGAGDCEDFAIVKYLMLHQLGVADADLKLLLVRDTAVRQDHAVLAVRVDGRWRVLDNRFDGVPDSEEVSRLMPLFALDRDGVGLFAAPYAAQVSHESERDMQPSADAGLYGGAALPVLL